MNKKLIFYSLLIIITLRLYFVFRHQLTLDYFFEIKEILINFTDKKFIYASIIYNFSFIFLMILSVPVAAVFATLSGMIFGFEIGLLYSTLSAILGGVISIFFNRYFLKDFVIKKYPREINSLNIFLKKNPRLTLFTLRFSPLFPFYIVNLILSVIEFNFIEYLIFGTIGKLPNLVILNFIGSNLRHAKNFEEINAIPLLTGMALISILPWIYNYFIKSKNYQSEV